MSEFRELWFKVGEVFTPGATINEKELFAGRIHQIGQILDAISQRGYHAVLYGERGIGKTSLSNVLRDFVQEATGANNKFFFTRINCDSSDNFDSLWRKTLKDISLTKQKSGIGFTSNDENNTESIIESLPRVITPDDIRRLLGGQLFQGIIPVLIFDEFDRLEDDKVTPLMADTIKSLSDYNVHATILIIGVADSVDKLITGHESIERALIQIAMPRMSSEEIEQIINNGLRRLNMKIDKDAMEEITNLSQGLPYIAHLLGLHGSKAALAKNTKHLTKQDIDTAINTSLDQWQQSIKSAYYEAVSSNQPDTIYKEVLLACALAATDDMGFFTAATVRHPLCIITGKKYEIPGFARHLKDFCRHTRGKVLSTYGEGGRRYRFSSPLMKPYVIMRGRAEGLISAEKMKEAALQKKLP